jgi:hypothetical protein
VGSKRKVEMTEEEWDAFERLITENESSDAKLLRKAHIYHVFTHNASGMFPSNACLNSAILDYSKMYVNVDEWNRSEQNKGG